MPRIENPRALKMPLSARSQNGAVRIMASAMMIFLNMVIPPLLDTEKF